MPNCPREAPPISFLLPADIYGSDAKCLGTAGCRFTDCFVLLYQRRQVLPLGDSLSPASGRSPTRWPGSRSLTSVAGRNIRARISAYSRRSKKLPAQACSPHRPSAQGQADPNLVPDAMKADIADAGDIRPPPASSGSAAAWMSVTRAGLTVSIQDPLRCPRASPEFHYQNIVSD